MTRLYDSPTDLLPRLTIVLRDEDAEALKLIRDRLEERHEYLKKTDLMRRALHNYAEQLDPSWRATDHTER